MSDKAIKGSCHCGAVEFEAVAGDRFLVSCNCSICRRLAALWLHSPPAPAAKITKGADNVLSYRWGDKEIDFNTCKTCGCTTHWSGVDNDRIAVNMRLADPKEIEGIRIRKFDGADSWEFFD